MIQLFNKETDTAIGTISEEQLAFLQEQLEEENSGDQDYYFNNDTLEVLEGNGADPALIGLLRNAFGQRGEVEIRWAKE